MKGTDVLLIVLLIFALLIPLAYSASIKELLAKYSFFAITSQMNVTSYADFMVDKNGNGINDTLVFELETSNAAGAFIFAISLIGKDGTLTNETSKALDAGTNKVNITFASTFLEQSQLNYSIKIYNLSHSLKYRKDNILTQNYSNYEEGFRVLDINDEKQGRTLKINVTINSPINGTHITTLFLSYNSSTIFSKGSKAIKNSVNHLLFDFDNETLKRTHYAGNFAAYAVKVGRKTIKTNFTTAFYDFRDFAASSYISGFAESAASTSTGNIAGKYADIQINVSLKIAESGNYSILLGLYDLFGNLVEQKSISYFFSSGNKIALIAINGSRIYEKKLNGPFIVKYAKLYQDNTIIDEVSDAYTTEAYNFNDFDSKGLPDLKVKIDVSDSYRYGINNITANFTIKNVGDRHAFNVFTEIFDNKTFFKAYKSDILNANTQIVYQINFTNVSDFEISAIADLQDAIEELNESNNAERVAIKLNKLPVLVMIKDIAVNETDEIIVNLSASDPNGDYLFYSINSSKFSGSLNAINSFKWKTTAADSGNYTLSATASDGFLNDVIIFKIAVLDKPEIDIDNDGIEDSIDELIGDENLVNTSTFNLSIFIGNSRNLSKRFKGLMNIRLMDNNLAVTEFDFNFSKHKLSLRNLTIERQRGNSKGSLIVRGLALPENRTKTLHLDKVNSSLNGICIKDDEISSISEISSSCNASNEFKIECDGTLQYPYTCIYNSTSKKYKIQGLKQSGIVQIDYTKPSESSTPTFTSSSLPPSSGASAGGSSSSSRISKAINGGIAGEDMGCISDWQCSEWAACIGGFKNRQCIDANQCPSKVSKPPAETQPCGIHELNSVSIINPLGHVKEALSKAKKGVQSAYPKEFAGISSQAVKLPDKKPDVGIFIVFAEVFIIVGSYLAIKIFENL